MDKNTLIEQLNKAVPSSILDVRRFGRSDILSIWVETQSIDLLASTVKAHLDLQLDWLENLSVIELEGALVITYFLRSFSKDTKLIIRSSVVPSTAHEYVNVPSIRSIWSMGKPMEDEAEEMFGIRFQVKPGLGFSQDHYKQKLMPEGWQGFPLRKSYSFPQEFYGIHHFRPFNSLKQKKSSHES